MSEEQTPQVDYIPDSKASDDSGQPKVSCKNCFHKDLCYWYTQLFTIEEGMKQASIKIKLPYDASILATSCTRFITNKGETAPEPEKTQDEKELVEESNGQSNP